MSNNGIIEHRKDYFYIEFREEYLIISMNCKYKKPAKDGAKCKASHHCKALILAILERWTDTKRKKGEDLAVYMTYPQWVDEMHGLFGRNVIIDSLDELLGEGLISREKHKMYGKDTYKYYLNYKELNRRIKLLPQGKAFTSKRDEPDDAFISKSEAFTSKRDTRLLVNEDAFTKGRNIESNIDSKNIDSNERKNDESQQKSNSEEKQESHSFVQSFSSPQNKFSPKGTEPEEKPEEIVFPLEAEQVYENAAKLHLTYLKRDDKHRDNCIILADNGVTTVEKLESLMQYCRQIPFLAGRSLNLKNLVNELNGWLQVQPSATPARQGSADDPIERYRATQRRAEQSRLREEARAGVARSSYDDDDYVDDTFYPVRHIVTREGAS